MMCSEYLREIWHLVGWLHMYWNKCVSKKETRWSYLRQNNFATDKRQRERQKIRWAHTRSPEEIKKDPQMVEGNVARWLQIGFCNKQLKDCDSQLRRWVLFLYSKWRQSCERTEYYYNHKEADTRRIFHLKNLPEKADVVVRTADTDVLVIALGSVHLIGDKHEWLEVRKFMVNSPRFIDVTNILNKLCAKHYRHSRLNGIT